MSEDPGPARRRHRRRATAAQGPAPALSGQSPSRRDPSQPTQATNATDATQPQPTGHQTEPSRRRRPPREHGERGLRDLVGSGRSQLGVIGALRARDVNRPSDDDLAEAEREIVIVRRNWQPET